MAKKVKIWLMIACALLFTVLVVSNVSMKSDAETIEYTIKDQVSTDGNWRVWVQKGDGKCIIHPVTTKTIDKVNSGAVVIPATVSVKGVKKPIEVTTIGNGAYKGNTKITSVNFKNAVNLTSIRANAFYGCTNLKRVYYLNYATKLTVIGAGAFQGDKLLESTTTGGLVLPVGLTKIDANAFNGCAKIAVINAVRPTKLSSIGKDAFKGIKSNCITYVPNTSIKTVVTGKIPGSVIVYYYNIIYNSNDGQNKKETDSKIAYQTDPDTPEITSLASAGLFTRTGYKFQKWNTKADGKGTSYAADQEVYNLTKNGQINLYAIWKANTYTVQFVTNAPKGFDTLKELTVSGTMNNVGCTYGTAKAMPANAYSIKGFSFGGWYKDAKCTSGPVTSLSNLTPVNGGVVKLYAKWIPITYTIRYDANGGRGEMYDRTMTYNSSVNLSTCYFENEGYKFAGWSTDNTGKTLYKAGTSVSNMTETNGATITFYAIWKPISYSVVFVKPDLYEDEEQGIKASVSGQIDRLYADYDESKPLPDGYSCKGYTFNGWMTKTGRKVDRAYELTTEDNGEVYLYADMQPVEYTVKFDSNGGTLKEGADEYGSVKMKYSKTYAIDCDRYERTGYKLTGWSTEKNGTGQFTKAINLMDTAGEVTLYAKWTPITYTITFDANVKDGDTVDGYTDPVRMTYDKPSKIGMCGFEYKGHVFTGWNTEPDGSGMAITDNQVVENLSATDKAVFKLYAQWRLIKYTVKFDIGIGATGTAPDSIECEYGRSFAVPEYDSDAMSRPGYRLDYWCTNINGVEEGDGNSAIEPGQSCDIILADEDGAEVILYAVWRSESFKLRYVTGTDEQIKDSNKISTNSSRGIITPGADSSYKEGYEFAGWNTKEDGTGTQIDDRFMPLNSKEVIRGGTIDEEDGYTIVVTLYAQWTPNTYEIMINLNSPGYGNGSLGANTQMTYTVAFGEKFAAKLPTPTLKGCDFLGWAASDDKLITEDSEYKYTDDIEVHPVWKIKQFTLKFDCSGASISGKNTYTKIYNYNEKIGNVVPVLTTAQKSANKKFVGWYYIKNVNGKQVKRYLTKDTKVTSSVTLQADISRPTYKVTYNLNYKKNNRVVKGYENVLYNQKLGELGTRSIYSRCRKRTGYLFGGWYYKSGNRWIKVENNTRIEGSVTLTAKWIKPAVVKNATKINNTKKTMTVSWKEDSRFIGFQYKAVFKESDLKRARIYTVNKKAGKKLGNCLQVSTSQKFVVIQVRAIFKDSNGKPAYSAWTTFRDVGCTRASATFDPKGGKIYGTQAVRKVVFVKGKSLMTSSTLLSGKLYTPVRSGYEFMGWYYRAGGREIPVNIRTTLPSGARVYAKWKRK